MRILVIGRTGQVATSLAEAGKRQGFEAVCLGRNEIDALSKSAIEQALFRFRPDAVVNAAAYTAVDKAESDQDASYALNQRVPRLLAEATKAASIPFIHLSTDYVFDGNKPVAYQPDDSIHPLGVYGASKATGEIAVRTANPAAIILRTAWVYSATGSNFVKRMLELGAKRDELRVVDDQIGNPTFAEHVADACFRLAMHQKFRAGKAGGIYHYAGLGDVTWYGFATAIFAAAKAKNRLTPVRIIPITTAEYPTPARRPANSRLDCSATEETFDIASKPWQIGLETCLEQLLSSPE